MRARRAAERGRRAGCACVEAGPDYGPYDGGRWPRDILDARQLAFSHAWETEREDRSQLRARIMGGCSAHNACVVLAGAPADYDEWGEGWSHAVIAPYLERAERELRVRRFADEELSPWHRAFARAAGADAIVHPVNDVGAVRWNAAFAYLDAARGRESLTIRADTLVDRVLFSGDRAIGVATSDGDVHADHVVLAAGAYGSPGILLRSDARRAARAADRRGADRPRRRRLRLRGHRPPAARGGGVRARVAPLHGAGHDRGAQRRLRRGRVRPLPLPGARPAGPGGLSRAAPPSSR